MVIAHNWVFHRETVDKISKIFSILDENDDSFKFLVETNNKCEFMWRFYFKFIVGGFAVITVIVATLSTLFCFWFNGDFDPRYVYHPFRHAWVRKIWFVKKKLDLVSKNVLSKTVQTKIRKREKRILISFVSLKVYLGMTTHRLVTWAKYYSIHLLGMHFSLATVCLCCSSFQCVHIIRHFSKCSIIPYANWINRTKAAKMNSYFAN